MISFKKGNYFIYCFIKNGGGKKELKYVNGYLFEYDGIRMGVKNEGGVWNITDIKTGLKINNFDIYRKEDIEGIFQNEKPGLLDAVRKAHKDDSTKEAIKLVASEYDKLKYKGKHKLLKEGFGVTYTEKNIEDSREKIRELANLRRLAALSIPKVKSLVWEFDGKVYNRRFDQALSELSDEVNRFFMSNSYDIHYIEWIPVKHNSNNYIALLNCGAIKKDSNNPLFDANKRIKAEKFLEGLTISYAKLMHEATDLEYFADNLAMLVTRLETAKNNYNAVVDAMPYEVTDILRVKHFY